MPDDIHRAKSSDGATYFLSPAAALVLLLLEDFGSSRFPHRRRFRFHLRRGDANDREFASPRAVTPSGNWMSLMWMASPTFRLLTSMRIISGRSFGRHSTSIAVQVDFQNAAEILHAGRFAVRFDRDLRVQLLVRLHRVKIDVQHIARGAGDAALPG